jgi:hypothetical protein
MMVLLDFGSAPVGDIIMLAIIGQEFSLLFFLKNYQR